MENYIPSSKCKKTALRRLPVYDHRVDPDLRDLALGRRRWDFELDVACLNDRATVADNAPVFGGVAAIGEHPGSVHFG